MTIQRSLSLPSDRRGVPDGYCALAVNASRAPSTTPTIVPARRLTGRSFRHARRGCCGGGLV